LSGVLTHPDLAHNAGAAVASELNHLLVVAMLRERDAENAANFADRAAMWHNIFPQETQGGKAGTMGLGPVFKFYARLDRAIVAAADDLAHACGIAAAANVFEQKCVIEVSERGIGKAEFRSQTHAKQATPKRMAGNRSFGEIESERQSGNDLCQRGGTGICRSRLNCCDLAADSWSRLLPEDWARYRSDAQESSLNIIRLLIDTTFAGVPRQNTYLFSNQIYKTDSEFGMFPCKTDRMVRLPQLLVGFFARCLRSRRDLVLENLALRQQLGVLNRKHSQRRFGTSDRMFWVILRRLWRRGWKQTLVLVQPETVIRWHRTGFRLYWKWISRKHAVVGRKPTSQELRELIFRMVAENRTWGAPRIHGELKMLGFDISERTVLRWMRKAPRDSGPARQWAAFLSNHREAIAAMDFFTVPTLAFGALYCFFVIAHDRRRILHFNVTRYPATPWVAQQLREAFPYDPAPEYLIMDREHTFNGEVLDTLESLGVSPVRIAIRR
jgi:hypothetical protein